MTETEKFTVDAKWVDGWRWYNIVRQCIPDLSSGATAQLPI